MCAASDENACADWPLKSISKVMAMSANNESCVAAQPCVLEALKRMHFHAAGPVWNPAHGGAMFEASDKNDLMPPICQDHVSGMMSAVAQPIQRFRRGDPHKETRWHQQHSVCRHKQQPHRGNDSSNSILAKPLQNPRCHEVSQSESPNRRRCVGIRIGSRSTSRVKGRATVVLKVSQVLSPTAGWSILGPLQCLRMAKPPRCQSADPRTKMPQ